MNKELKILVNRLNRIFPSLKLYNEGEYFSNTCTGKGIDIEDDFSPPITFDWFDLIKILKDNGLEIKNIKDEAQIKG